MCTFFFFHCPHFFSEYSRSYNVCVLFSTFFSFIAVIQVLQCLFLIFHVLHCFLPYSRSYSVFFILHVFQCFSPYVMSYHVSFSFSSFVNFLAIFQVLQCAIFIFQVFQFSCHIPGPTVCVPHFHHLSVFQPYSRSYSVCVSFSRFSHFSSHIPGPTLCVSYFARFKCFLPYFMSYHVSFSFSLFLSFLAIFQVLLCEFLIFLFSQFSHHIPGPTVCIPHFPSFSFSFFLFLPYFKS